MSISINLRSASVDANGKSVTEIMIMIMEKTKIIFEERLIIVSVVSLYKQVY
jgi:hypothetical protein